MWFRKWNLAHLRCLSSQPRSGKERTETPPRALKFVFIWANRWSVDHHAANFFRSVRSDVKRSWLLIPEELQAHHTNLKCLLRALYLGQTNCLIHSRFEPENPSFTLVSGHFPFLCVTFPSYFEVFTADGYFRIFQCHLGKQCIHLIFFKCPIDFVLFYEIQKFLSILAIVNVCARVRVSRML